MTGCSHLTLAVLRDVALSWPWEKFGAWKERRERCHWLTDGAGQSTCKGGPVAMITSFLHICIEKIKTKYFYFYLFSLKGQFSQSSTHLHPISNDS